MKTETAKPLTARPLAQLNGSIRPKIMWNEALRLMDEYASKGLNLGAAAERVFEQGIAIGKRGRPFKDPKSLAASVSSLRNRLVKPGGGQEPSSSPDLRDQIRGIFALPAIDDPTRLKIIRALVGLRV